MIFNKSPSENAMDLAGIYMQGAYQRLEARQADAKKKSGALDTLSKAMGAFKTALAKLSSQDSLQRYKATVSNPDYAKVAVSTGATPGTYSFKVNQLATSHQIAISGLPDVEVAQAGELRIVQADGSELLVDLTKAKPDDAGNLTATELARVINEAAGKSGALSATVVTAQGQARLVLSSGKSGLQGEITLDTSAIGDDALRDVLSGVKHLVLPKDAEFEFGTERVITMTSSSNTYTGIDGLEVTFTHATKPGDAPVEITVGRDEDATVSSVQELVDAYNAIRKVLGELGASGDAMKGIDAGPMAGDSGIRALQLRLNEMIRHRVDGKGLFDLGVSADRYGEISLDRGKLKDRIAGGGAVLDRLLGSDAQSVTKKIGNHLDAWLGPVDGHLRKQKDSITQIQNALSKQKTSLDDQYTRVYERYVAQFSRVQLLEDQMTYTLSLLESLSPSKSK